ncbi:MAG: hypothetical protein KJ000_29410 [Pirellulaceae bacterium]|nr:hypothetical protein [Pirellulaceae bacterium]
MTVGLTQISANISVETKQRMEQYVRAHGMKESHLIETALLHHLRALDELPEDIVIPPVLKVTHESGERLLQRLETPSAPSAAMKALFDD